MRPSGALGLTTPSRNGTPGRPARPSAAAPSAAIKVIASVVANVTLLTGLLVWFGLLYTQVFFEFLRVHPTVLDQPTEDILTRGVDGLFVPFAVLAAVSLLGLCAVRYLRARLSSRTWAAVLRAGAPVAAVAGLALVVLAAVAAARPDGQVGYPGLAGLGLAVGVLLLLLAWRQVGTAGVVEWVLVLLLVVVGLFWAVSDYSQAVGVQRAWETAQRIPELPDLLLYRQKSLNLTVAVGEDGVRSGRSE